MCLVTAGVVVVAVCEMNSMASFEDTNRIETKSIYHGLVRIPLFIVFF